MANPAQVGRVLERLTPRCPFAPGASGNVGTGDLVHCLHAVGVETGVALDALIETSWGVQEIVGRALPGQLVKAGKWDRRYPLPDGVRERIPGRS
jgi:hydroxymethylglutaryl-CoA lyase